MDYLETVIGKKKKFKDPKKIYQFDSHTGFLYTYEWHRKPLRHGAQFTPVFHIIEVLRDVGLNSDLLDCFYRRVPYACVCKEEIEFLSERYNWNEFKYIQDYMISRFEDLVRTICDLFLLTIVYYQKYFYSDEYIKVYRFEDIFTLFKEDKSIPRLLKPFFINPSLNYTLFMYVRNCIVHNPGKLKYVEKDQNPSVVIENIDQKRRFGIFREYMEDVLNMYDGKKTPGNYVNIIDGRFDYFRFSLKLTKKTTLNFEESLVGIEISIIELSKMFLNELFHIQFEIYKTMLYLHDKNRFHKEGYMLQ